jgi:invasion protein IalB
MAGKAADIFAAIAGSNVMRLFSVASGAASLMLVFGAAPASSQSQATGQPAAPAQTKDPNRVICQRIEDIGSRLASKRICMTSQQWDEQRRQDRMTLQDLQQHQTEPSGH